MAGLFIGVKNRYNTWLPIHCGRQGSTLPLCEGSLHSAALCYEPCLQGPVLGGGTIVDL